MIVTVVWALAVGVALVLAAVLLEGAAHHRAGVRFERDLRRAEVPRRTALKVVATGEGRAVHDRAA